jgi:hypothetical protein
MKFKRKHQWKKTSKGKQVLEDLYLIYTTSCREVKCDSGQVQHIYLQY